MTGAPTQNKRTATRSDIDNTFVIEAIRASLDKVYLVGGAVRDSLMGTETVGSTSDLDFSTPLTPEKVTELLRKDGYRVNDLGIKFGTVSTTIAGVQIEITSFRTEEYEDGSRKPNTTFKASILDDLARRDFTINAIAHDGNEYIDPFNGSKDVIDGVIRAVSDPELRFTEDPLRILRAIRFVSQLGFTIEQRTFDALYKNAHLVKRLSGERIDKELREILCGKNWQRALSIIIEGNLLNEIFGIMLNDAEKTELMERLQSVDDGEADMINRWSILLSSINHSIISVKSNLKIPHKLLSLFKSRLNWSNKFSESLYEKFNSRKQKEDADTLEKELKKLQADNDDRSYVVEERLLKIRIHQLVDQLKFNSVKKSALRVLKVQRKNMELRIARGESKEDVIRTTYPYALAMLKYVCIPNFLSGKYIENNTDLNSVLKEIAEDHEIFSNSPINIGKQDRYKVIENCLLMLISVIPRKVTSLKKYEVLMMNDFIKNDEQRLDALKSYCLHELVEVKQKTSSLETSLERASINKTLAEVSLEMSGTRDLSYYEFLVDAYKWAAISSSKSSEFWAAYEKMNEAMDEYEKIALRDQMQFKRVTIGFYLDNAQALLRMLDINKSLAAKKEILVSVIGNYKLAGPYFKKNCDRFQLIYDWYVVANKLVEAEGKISDFRVILKSLQKSKSYKYIDIDEDFIKENMPEITMIRENIGDAETFLNRLIENEQDAYIIRNFDTSSIANLLVRKYIDKKTAFELYKKVLRIQLNETDEIEPLKLVTEPVEGGPDINENTAKLLSLIKKGENELVEFKASWRYNVKSKMKDDAMRAVVIRCIVAFMNSSGGTLFIGVNDKGEIDGLEKTDYVLYEKGQRTPIELQDKIRVEIGNELAKSLGVNVSSTLVGLTFEYYEDKTFIVVNVKKSAEPIYYDNGIYVRNLASSRFLDGKEMVEFVLNRVKV